MTKSENYCFGPLLYRSKINRDLIIQLIKRGNQSNDTFDKNLPNLVSCEKTYSPADQEYFSRVISNYMYDYMEARKQWYGEKDYNESFILQDLWINYIKCGDYVPYQPSNCDLSFVIYVQVPMDLRKEYLEFKSVIDGGIIDRGSHRDVHQLHAQDTAGPGSIEFKYGQPEQGFVASRHFYPREGDIYIFPSNFYNITYPYKTEDRLRIEVRGNFNIRKETLPSVTLK
jgi:hypothetical protein